MQNATLGACLDPQKRIAVSIKIRKITEISKKIDHILSPIARKMYLQSLQEFLYGCKHDTITNLADTILNLHLHADIPHRYIWDMPSFEKCLYKIINSTTIKKDMSSRTYKKCVEQMIGSCYPSAFPHFGLMLVLNADYHTDWIDIYDYFSLCRFEPQYREKYRYRPARQVKAPKPLTDNMVTTALEYSGHSIKFSRNIYYLYNKDRARFRGFMHVLCGLQELRKDYNFFDKQLLEKVATDYWNTEYEKTLTEYDKRALNAGDETNFLEAMINKVETEQHYKDFEENGEPYYREVAPDRDYDKEIRQLEEQIKEVERFVGQYEADYQDQIKHIYNGFWDKADIWPTDEQCNTLWLTYHNTHNVMLNSIAVLVHKIPKKDWNRIIAYYAINERRIMLAENPILDKVSDDPYIIHPKLERPITDKLIDGLKFSPKYKGVTAEQIDIRWEETNKSGLRQGLMYIMFVLQSNGAELIKPDIFSEVFKKQIESDKNDGPYFHIEYEMIDEVIKNICNDKKDEVCKIAILLDKGYRGDEVYNYWQGKLEKK